MKKTSILVLIFLIISISTFAIYKYIKLGNAREITTKNELNLIESQNLVDESLQPSNNIDKEHLPALEIKWDTTNDLEKKIELLVNNNTIIDWGDGNVEEIFCLKKGDEEGIILTHKYEKEEIFTVKILDDVITHFGCEEKLKSLDVSKNSSLKLLYLSDNDLNSLDVSKNIALESLECIDNNLTNLDVSKNINLTELYCQNNLLKTLHINGTNKLTLLNCSSNQLKTLDVSNNKSLLYLNCMSNELENLDVTYNTQLWYLYCTSNKLNNLDISMNMNLENLWCEQETLTTLFMDINQSILPKKHNNTNIVFVDNSNSNISVPAIELVWDTTSYRTWDKNCELKKSIILATNAETIIDWGDGIFENIENTNGNDLQLTHEYEKYGIFSVRIKDDVVTKLDCSLTNLNSLNISKNAELKYLDCCENNLTELIIDKNISLEYLNCWGNELSNLDVSKNINLDYLNCELNALRNLDISKNISLTQLNCYGNHLTDLDVSKNINLMYLNCALNDLSNLDVSNNLKLETLWCYNDNLKQLDISKNKFLKELHYYGETTGNNPII